MESLIFQVETKILLDCGLGLFFFLVQKELQSIELNKATFQNDKKGESYKGDEGEGNFRSSISL